MEIISAFLCVSELCPKSQNIALCATSVFSVVDEFRAKTHHRDTENTEVAQRSLGTWTFEAKRRFCDKCMGTIRVVEAEAQG